MWLPKVEVCGDLIETLDPCGEFWGLGILGFEGLRELLRTPGTFGTTGTFGDSGNFCGLNWTIIFNNWRACDAGISSFDVIDLLLGFC